MNRGRMKNLSGDKMREDFPASIRNDMLSCTSGGDQMRIKILGKLSWWDKEIMASLDCHGRGRRNLPNSQLVPVYHNNTPSSNS